MCNKFVCSCCCQLLCYRLIRWFCVYSHSESTKTALECALRFHYSGKKTDKFSKRGFKIWNIFLFSKKMQFGISEIIGILKWIPNYGAHWHISKRRYHVSAFISRQSRRRNNFVRVKERLWSILWKDRASRTNSQLSCWFMDENTWHAANSLEQERTMGHSTSTRHGPVPMNFFLNLNLARGMRG